MTGLRAKLKALYRDGSVQLSVNGDELPGIDENTFKAAIRRIFRNQGFTADDLSHPKVRQLVDAYTKAYEGAISPSLASGVIPEVMAKKGAMFLSRRLSMIHQLRLICLMSDVMRT